ncbi:MAG: hypothetical protein RL885_29490 [Planctomycetota bacterium]
MARLARFALLAATLILTAACSATRPRMALNPVVALAPASGSATALYSLEARWIEIRRSQAAPHLPGVMEELPTGEVDSPNALILALTSEGRGELIASPRITFFGDRCVRVFDGRGESYIKDFDVDEQRRPKPIQGEVWEGIELEIAVTEKDGVIGVDASFFQSEIGQYPFPTFETRLAGHVDEPVQIELPTFSTSEINWRHDLEDGEATFWMAVPKPTDRVDPNDPTMIVAIVQVREIDTDSSAYRGKAFLEDF